MKKTTLFVITAIVLAVVFAIGSFAAVTPVEYEANTDGVSFDISYTGTAGKYYALVIVEGITDGAPAITEDNIQYIDQLTADKNGAVLFDDIVLKDDGTAATVYLGGADPDGAVLLGWVNKVENSFAVSGTVTSVNSSAATVTLTSTSDEEKVYTVNTAAGTYTISVPADTYKFVVTKAAHLSYTDSELEVADNVTKNVTLTAGDLVAPFGTIEYEDLATVLNNYEQDVSAYDIDGSGLVDYEDLAAILNNYEATATVE